MAHGYLGDGYGSHGEIDPDRDDGREPGRRDWRDRNLAWRDRDRGPRMMFGDDERGWRGQRSGRWSEGDGRTSRDWSGQDRYSAHPDDHYRSWRDRHMSELDRDYQDYCREREQAFHSEFDTWRQQRHANYQPLRTGMTNSGMSHDPEGGVQVATEGLADRSGSDPTADATLGTNSEGSSTGRGRR